MALSDSALSELLCGLRVGDGTDLVRELAQWALQQLIEAEAAEKIGAARYERSDARVTHRNGSRRKTLSTKAGDLVVGIPKLRAGSFFPSLLEPRRRIDQALDAVVMEAWVKGGSATSVAAPSASRSATAGAATTLATGLVAAWVQLGTTLGSSTREVARGVSRGRLDRETEVLTLEVTGSRRDDQLERSRSVGRAPSSCPRRGALRQPTGFGSARVALSCVGHAQPGTVTPTLRSLGRASRGPVRRSTRRGACR